MKEQTLTIKAEDVKISDLLITEHSNTPEIIEYIAQGSEDDLLEIVFFVVHDEPIRLELAYDDEITVIRYTHH